MIQYFYRFLIELTNGRWTSALLRRFAQSKASRLFVPSFSKVYKLNVDEMDQSLNEFPTLHHLFTRRLKVGSRPISNDASSVVSPVDAVIEEIGTLIEELFMPVKGKRYSVLDMLGTEERVKKYINGTYIILYLSPSDYHRIHSPFSGRVVGEWTLGSKSYPVNKYGLKYGKDTLAKNYRKITEVEHEAGFAAIIKVGAMFVNSIETTFKGERIEKGEEIAYFTFGSTVILLFEANSFEPIPDLKSPRRVKVGETLGYLKTKEWNKI